MATQVGIREFRDNLSTYLLESDAPIEITRHGDTVGVFIPTRRKRTEEDRARFWAAAARVDETMRAAEVSEEQLLEDVDELLREKQRARRETTRR